MKISLRHIALCGALLLTTLCVEGQEAVDSLVDIHRVEIVGRRPMNQIGVQRTEFDSVVLKEHIALSIADVLTYNSSIFVKSYGRATLSTVAFRGTSPSHTQVLWNGLRINSPLMGMTDFSMIPSHLIDQGSLLHGSSSVTESGGGLGGAVKLTTKPTNIDGWQLEFVQGIGSFKTFDEYLRVGYGNDRWQLSTRLIYATSPNDYRYTNYDKKENIYDEEHNIIAQYHPTERNRNGDFSDFHALQEIYYRTDRGDRLSLVAWYTGSDRGVPMMSTSYATENQMENRQREETLRALAGWERIGSSRRLAAKIGYIHTWAAYDRRMPLTAPESGSSSGEAGLPDGTLERSRNRVNTLYGNFTANWSLGERWLIGAEATAHHHMVESEGKEVIGGEGTTRLGFEKGRTELTTSASVRWRATERLGIGLTLREELYGNTLSPLIPALFVDQELIRGGALLLKGSVSRNYRFATLNDLYFQPGGNPDLKPEEGWSYDLGIGFDVGRGKPWHVTGSATWFDSHIDDWIIWYPKAMGYYSPINIKQVHAYGVELDAALDWQLSSRTRLKLHGAFAWSPSINEGDPFSSADRSMGKQLPYVPEYSASATAHLAWRSWSLLYKWSHYSERYTLSSNATTLTGRLPAYSMNDLTLEKRWAASWADLSLKGSVRNLFDKEYVSVLSHPMPGINFELFISIVPRWGEKKRE